MPVEKCRELGRSCGTRSRCPFYGFRCPDKTTGLTEVGGKECGLELDAHGSCLMEMTGKIVDYVSCPVALHYRNVAEIAAPTICFFPTSSPGNVPEGGVPFERWRRHVIGSKPG